MEPPEKNLQFQQKRNNTTNIFTIYEFQIDRWRIIIRFQKISKSHHVRCGHTSPGECAALHDHVCTASQSLQ